MKGILAICWFIALWLGTACSSGTEKMILPDDLELVNQSSEKDSVCFSCHHQVVVYLNFDKSSFFGFSKDFLWPEFRERFPEVSFVFYFSGQDREKLVRELKDLEFPYPGFHDPDFRFYHANRLDTVNSTYDVQHSFHLQDGFFIKWAQIGMGNRFIEELEERIKSE